MEIILGHLVGDYLFQSDWMALNKKKNSFIGYIACIIHCLIWTFSIGIFIELTLAQYVLIFASHFAIDKYNFVKWYLNFFRIMPNPALWKIIIVDNTIHLILLFFILHI